MSQPNFRSGRICEVARALATLTRAGLSIVEAVTEVGADAPSEATYWKAVVGRLRQGHSLAQQLRGWPALYVEMIAVGEETGQLTEVLDKLADTLDREREVKAVQRSLIKPAATLVFSVALNVGILGYLVPFMYENMDVEPEGGIGGFGVSFGMFLDEYGLTLLLTIVASVVALVMYGNTPEGRDAIDRTITGIPYFGRSRSESKFGIWAGYVALIAGSGQANYATAMVRVVDMLSVRHRARIRQFAKDQETRDINSLVPDLVSRKKGADRVPVLIGTAIRQTQTTGDARRAFDTASAELLNLAKAAITKQVKISQGTIFGLTVVGILIGMLGVFSPVISMMGSIG